MRNCRLHSSLLSFSKLEKERHVLESYLKKKLRNIVLLLSAVREDIYIKAIGEQKYTLVATKRLTYQCKGEKMNRGTSDALNCKSSNLRDDEEKNNELVGENLYVYKCNTCLLVFTCVHSFANHIMNENHRVKQLDSLKNEKYFSCLRCKYFCLSIVKIIKHIELYNHGHNILKKIKKQIFYTSTPICDCIIKCYTFYSKNSNFENAHRGIVLNCRGYNDDQSNNSSNGNNDAFRNSIFKDRVVHSINEEQNLPFLSNVSRVRTKNYDSINDFFERRNCTKTNEFTKKITERDCTNIVSRLTSSPCNYSSPLNEKNYDERALSCGQTDTGRDSLTNNNHDTHNIATKETEMRKISFSQVGEQKALGPIFRDMDKIKDFNNILLNLQKFEEQVTKSPNNEIKKNLLLHIFENNYDFNEKKNSQTLNESNWSNEKISDNMEEHSSINLQQSDAFSRENYEQFENCEHITSANRGYDIFSSEGSKNDYGGAHEGTHAGTHEGEYNKILNDVVVDVKRDRSAWDENNQLRNEQMRNNFLRNYGAKIGARGSKFSESNSTSSSAMDSRRSEHTNLPNYEGFFQKDGEETLESIFSADLVSNILRKKQEEIIEKNPFLPSLKGSSGFFPPVPMTRERWDKASYANKHMGNISHGNVYKNERMYITKREDYTTNETSVEENQTDILPETFTTNFEDKEVEKHFPQNLKPFMFGDEKEVYNEHGDSITHFNFKNDNFVTVPNMSSDGKGCTSAGNNTLERNIYGGINEQNEYLKNYETFRRIYAADEFTGGDIQPSYNNTELKKGGNYAKICDFDKSSGGKGTGWHDPLGHLEEGNHLGRGNQLLSNLLKSEHCGEQKEDERKSIHLRESETNEHMHISNTCNDSKTRNVNDNEHPSAASAMENCNLFGKSHLEFLRSIYLLGPNQSKQAYDDCTNWEKGYYEENNGQVNPSYIHNRINHGTNGNYDINWNYNSNTYHGGRSTYPNAATVGMQQVKRCSNYGRFEENTKHSFDMWEKENWNYFNPTNVRNTSECISLNKTYGEIFTGSGQVYTNLHNANEHMDGRIPFNENTGTIQKRNQFIDEIYKLKKSIEEQNKSDTLNYTAINHPYEHRALNAYNTPLHEMNNLFENEKTKKYNVFHSNKNDNPSCFYPDFDQIRKGNADRFQH
ncbi:conserved Plasmodium protein, unknown function [Plasmodium ovale wallikeri]|uniref:C2H2-type domain-containing protein n=1 Tax=Plasmodium ovale wallikeri TaxID=864142 RepID=A0A1A8YJK5_PLAOA|nr:conserved Plasmodium protein, unknown function [Plasmodium ovale wallikeri]